MDMFQLHAVGTSGWLSLHGVTLLLMPGTICASLIKETRPLSDLETYLARTGALAELTLALLLVTLSGALTSFLTSQSDPSTTSSSSDPSTSSTNSKTPLLVSTTFLTATRAILYYVTSNNAAFNTTPFLVETFVSAGLAFVGGAMVLFGSGAGSEVKGRSHLMFESPEHKKEVKERHAAKKGL